jgi:hypothetical protein
MDGWTDEELSCVIVFPILPSYVFRKEAAVTQKQHWNKKIVNPIFPYPNPTKQVVPLASVSSQPKEFTRDHGTDVMWEAYMLQSPEFLLVNVCMYMQVRTTSHQPFHRTIWFSFSS